MTTTWWPSRAEWAKERRTPYYDRFPSTSNSFTEHATPENVRHGIRTLNGIMGFNHLLKLTKRQMEYKKLIQALVQISPVAPFSPR